jgi:hypothetical protein
VNRPYGGNGSAGSGLAAGRDTAGLMARNVGATLAVARTREAKDGLRSAEDGGRGTGAPCGGRGYGGEMGEFLHNRISLLNFLQDIIPAASYFPLKYAIKQYILNRH